MANVRKLYSARAELVMCALRYQATVIYNEEFVDDPHGSAMLEMEEEYLDKAVEGYRRAMVEEKHKDLPHVTDGTPCWCNPIVEDYSNG